MTVETWKPIPGWPQYEASDLGQVRRLPHKRVKTYRGKTYECERAGGVLAQKKHSNGYLSVRLYPGGQTQMVGRLVCLAFAGHPPTPEHEADHRNDRRDDNRAENLRWLSPTENKKRRTPAVGERANKSSLTEADVRRIREQAKSVPSVLAFDAAMAAALGVSRETVRDIRRGDSWKHVGQEEA